MNLRHISIHVLREEDDGPRCGCRCPRRYFYPRPPRGGRPHCDDLLDELRGISIHVLREEDDAEVRQAAAVENNFYPRPPRGGRRSFPPFSYFSLIFLSTSSARRTTVLHAKCAVARDISIHVLREEDDRRPARPPARPPGISIHVLREEDDA